MAFTPPALPVVTQTPGPTYASDVNASLAYINNFLSAPILIPSNVSVVGNLNFNGFGISNLSGLGLNPSTATTADLLRAETIAGNDELVWNDSSGNKVALTSMGNPAGTLGNIQGYPSSGNLAAITWTAGAPGTFTFTTDTTVSPRVANLVGGSFTFTDTATPIPSFAVTMASPSSLAASYTLTLPPALPTNRTGIAMDTSGNLIVSPGAVHMIVFGTGAGPNNITGVGPISVDPGGILQVTGALIIGGGVPMPYGGFITAMQINCLTGCTTPATNTFKVYKNGSPTSISATLGVGVTTGSASGSVSFMQGDFIQVGVTASTVSSGTTGTGIQVTVTFTTG